MVQTGDAVTAELVNFRNVGGFTGTYGADVVGDARAHISDGTFRISGTAMGSEHGHFLPRTKRRYTTTQRAQAHTIIARVDGGLAGMLRSIVDR